jgi:hypothetical protein
MNAALKKRFPVHDTFFVIGKDDNAIHLFSNSFTDDDEEEEDDKEMEMRKEIFFYLVDDLNSFDSIVLDPSIIGLEFPADMEVLDWTNKCAYDDRRKRRREDRSSSVSSSIEEGEIVTRYSYHNNRPVPPSSTHHRHSTHHSLSNKFKNKLLEEIVDSYETKNIQNIVDLLLKEAIENPSLQTLLKKCEAVDRASMEKDLAVIKHEEQMKDFLSSCRSRVFA